MVVVAPTFVEAMRPLPMRTGSEYQLAPKAKVQRRFQLTVRRRQIPLPAAMQEADRQRRVQRVPAARTASPQLAQEAPPRAPREKQCFRGPEGPPAVEAAVPAPVPAEAAAALRSAALAKPALRPRKRRVQARERDPTAPMMAARARARRSRRSSEQGPRRIGQPPRLDRPRSCREAQSATPSTRAQTEREQAQVAAPRAARRRALQRRLSPGHCWPSPATACGAFSGWSKSRQVSAGASRWRRSWVREAAHADRACAAPLRRRRRHLRAGREGNHCHPSPGCSRRGPRRGMRRLHRGRRRDCSRD